MLFQEWARMTNAAYRHTWKVREHGLQSLAMRKQENSVMEQAEQLINRLEAEKTIFTSDDRNLIVNYAYKLDELVK